MALELRHSKGFGLIEVMMSVTILSIAMGAIFAVVNGAIKETSDARNKDIAVGLAQEGLEKARQARNLNQPTTAIESNVVQTIRDTAFSRTVTVEAATITLDGGEGNDWTVDGWRAAATISWSANNRNLTYTAKTFLGER